MKLIICFFSLLSMLTTTFASAQMTTIDFDTDQAGQLPKGFSTALTGKGKSGHWVVMRDDSAPSIPNVLAQTDMDTTSYRFPLCVYDDLTAKDVDESVKFKPVKGKEDQAAGIVLRYRDNNNYYVVRANALEGNVVFYKVEKGKRQDLKPKGSGFFTYGKKANVPSQEWSTLGVVAKGTIFEVYLDGNKQFEVEDDTFTNAGRVGLWTKADSYTLFDDFIVKPVDKE
jgi:hypothetical protein